jgi:amino acid permease
MKLIDTLLLSLSVALLIIGIYEVFLGRFAENYWVFMLMLASFFGYAYRRRQHANDTTAAHQAPPPSKDKVNKRRQQRRR